MKLLTREERKAVGAKMKRDAALAQRLNSLELESGQPAPAELVLAVLDSLKQSLDLQARVMRRLDRS
ncbi:hypothetical protein [Deinococcus alpinitundrae]|uniref:hypothetical protein n=1 Tax=Deinococcus alpinitundrae TaxID=468913 RepID=UPI00137AB0EB|nr:hypothetical protein [Deinococcus alpinitundrae]